MGWEHEGSSKVGAEFDADTDTDDEVNEGDGIKGYTPEGHDAEDVGDDHGDCEGNDEASFEGSEEEGRNNEGGKEGGRKESRGKTDDGGVLVEKDVEFGVGEDFGFGSLGDVL